MTAAAESTSVPRDVALVTGASRGIGRAVALALADRGISVCCTGRSLGDLTATMDECMSRGASALAVIADQRDESAIKESVARCESELGPITMFVNNAGAVRPGRFLDLDDASIQDELMMNLLAPAKYMHEVGRLMVSRQYGAIVAVSSNRAIKASKQLAAYSAAKAGLLHLCKCLAREWARDSVRVNAVCPGAVATEMNSDVRSDPAVLDRILRDIPAGRYALPTEVADLITFLLLPEAAMITGAAFVIDGGESA